jgi:low temperature requirement protein LtrA
MTRSARSGLLRQHYFSGDMHNTKYFEPNRRATWLELFFDLIFVVAIGDVTHILNHTHEGHLAPLRFW